MSAPAERDPDVTISLCGSFGILGSQGSWRPRSLKGQAIIAYLALKPDHQESRQKIAGLLWSESDEVNARVALRQVLSNLRKDERTFGMDLLVSSKSTLQLAPWQTVVTDLQLLEAELRNGRVPAELVERRAFFDHMLSAFVDLDQSFALWIQIERQAWIEKISGLLTGVITNAPPALAIDAAKALLNIDQTNEQACRVLMMQLHRAGDTAGALRAYSELWDILDKDFDIEPGPETQNLVVSIKRDQPEVLDIPAVRAEPPRIFVRVEALDAAPQASRVRLLGLRRAVLAALVRFRDWSVREVDFMPADIDRNILPKTYDLALTSAGDETDPGVQATFSRKLDGHYIWSEFFPFGSGDRTEINAIVVRRIGQALNVQITEDRLRQLADQNCLAADIYDRWLEAQNMLFGWEIETEQLAERMLREIIAERPDFANAICGLSQVLNTRHVIFPGIMRDRVREQQSLVYARKASRLAPMDNRTQLTLAWCYLLNDRFDQAELQFNLALRLNDIDPWTLCSAAQGLSYCGLHEQAQGLVDSALDIGIGLAPIHYAYQGFIRYLAGDFRGALDSILRSDEGTYFVGAVLAASYAQCGEARLGREAIEAVIARVEGNWHGEGSATPEKIFNWLVQLFPIRFAEDRVRFRQGLVKTGILGL